MLLVAGWLRTGSGPGAAESTSLVAVSWPIVAVSGGPRERGRAYGAAAHDRVHRSLELYEDVFRRSTGMRWPAVRDRAGAFADPIDAYDVRLLPEIEGIAEGAAVDAEDVLALNVRTEVMYGMGARECTALCAPSGMGEDAHVLLAQNWDWHPGAARTCVLLLEVPPDAPASLTLVEAGLLAKCGMNQAGIGLLANALTSTLDRGTPGVPFHAILHRILSSPSFDEAVDAVTTATRASSANYVIGSRDGRASDLEVTPGTEAGVHRSDGPPLAHANHFLRPSRDGFKDLERLDPDSTSAARQAAADRHLQDPAGRSVDDLLRTLRDHEAPVCRHAAPGEMPEAGSETIAAVAMDLAEGVLWVTEGRPCIAAVERFELDALVRDAA
jgi:isopenicillin-N N-acyltransferase-like protein